MSTSSRWLERESLITYAILICLGVAVGTGQMAFSEAVQWLTGAGAALIVGRSIAKHGGGAK